MRRKDRERSREFALALMDKAQYGTLSLAREGEAYGIALSLAREGDVLYFHSAKEGRKLDFLRENPRVSVLFVGEVEVPHLFEDKELAAMAEAGDLSVFVRKVFTTEYESAIATGWVEEVTNREEKIHGLKVICEKYTPHQMEYFPLAIEAGMERTRVFKIHMDEVTGKAKKYGEDGEESKEQ